MCPKGQGAEAPLAPATLTGPALFGDSKSDLWGDRRHQDKSQVGFNDTGRAKNSKRRTITAKEMAEDSQLAPCKKTGEAARKGRPSQGLPYRPGVHKIVVTGNHVAIPIQWEEVLPRLW